MGRTDGPPPGTDRWASSRDRQIGRLGGQTDGSPLGKDKQAATGDGQIGLLQGQTVRPQATHISHME